jgi:hypothetical protein
MQAGSLERRLWHFVQKHRAVKALVLVYENLLRQLAYAEEYLAKLYALAVAGLSQPIGTGKRDLDAEGCCDPETDL